VNIFEDCTLVKREGQTAYLRFFKSFRKLVDVVFDLESLEAEVDCDAQDVLAQTKN